MAKKKKKKVVWQVQVLLIGALIMAIIFLPTTILLGVGMLPTFVLFLIDRSKGKYRTLTVGAMNLAGCTPFIMEMWMTMHTMDVAIEHITTPRTIVIIYFAAAIGYLIDWAMTGIVATMMFQKGKLRLKDIEKEKRDLIKRWGEEVTGKIPLDAFGFPAEPLEVEQASAKKAEQIKKA